MDLRRTEKLPLSGLDISILKGGAVLSEQLGTKGKLSQLSEDFVFWPCQTRSLQSMIQFLSLKNYYFNLWQRQSMLKILSSGLMKFDKSRSNSWRHMSTKVVTVGVKTCTDMQWCHDVALEPAVVVETGSWLVHKMNVLRTGSSTVLVLAKVFPLYCCFKISFLLAPVYL